MTHIGSDEAANAILDACKSYKELRASVNVCVEKDAVIIDDVIFLNDKKTPFTGSSYCEYTEGVIKSKGDYKDGLKHGLFNYWTDRGSLGMQVNYENSFLNGELTIWYDPSSAKGIRLDGQKRKVEQYKVGVKDGDFFWWHENGNRSHEQKYKNGKKNGKWTRYYETGNILMEEHFSEDLKDGRARRWYENGLLLKEEFYKKGKKNGIWTRWYENGKMLKTETYVDGEKNGKSIWYYDDGKTMKESNFKNGLCSGDC